MYCCSLWWRRWSCTYCSCVQDQGHVCLMNDSIRDHPHCFHKFSSRSLANSKLYKFEQMQIHIRTSHSSFTPKQRLGKEHNVHVYYYYPPTLFDASDIPRQSIIYPSCRSCKSMLWCRWWWIWLPNRHWGHSLQCCQRLHVTRLPQ